MFTLITTLYWERNESRQKEYLYCLDRNIKNPNIDMVVIFYQTVTKKDPFLKKIKKRKGVRIVCWNRRPTFREIFGYANKRLTDRNIVLANADIFYDLNKGLNLLVDIRLNHLILILTRYNIVAQVEDFMKDYPNKLGVFSQSTEGTLMSQTNGKSVDSWIFQTPIKPDFKCDFKLGTYNCDSYMNHELLKSFRYEVYNPCLDVISVHYHNKWHPNKYKTVTDDDGNQIALQKWCEINNEKGCHPMNIPFCRLAHVIPRM